MAAFPGVGVVTLDTDLRIRSWNDWLARATGVPALVAVGRPMTDFVPAARAAAIGDDLAEVLRDGITRVLAPAFHRYLVLCPPPLRNDHFQEMQQRVTLAPLHDDARVVGVIIAVEDVTERLVAERELAAAPVGGATRVAQAGADDWRVRGEATRSLVQAATEDDIAQLLAALERDHNDFSVLSGALQVLTGARQDVTTPLLGLLRNSNANVRIHAALALGAIGDRASVPGLLAALDDADSNVRFHAIEALGRLADPDAVPALQRVAASGDFFLAFPAIDALALIDDADVVPALMTLLDQDDLRPAVIEALASLGDEDCVGLLAGLINDGRGDVLAVCNALVKIARRYDDTFAAGAFVSDATVATLSPEGIARLAAVVSDPARVDGATATVLGWTGAAGLEALASAVGQASVQREVTEALLAAGSAAVGPLLRQLEEGTPAARLAAAFLLGAIGDRQAGPALVRALASHDTELVTVAARALAALGEPSALDGLCALFGHQDVMVRQAATAAVNALGADVPPGFLVSLLEDPDPRVRECAVRTSGYFAFATCLPGLLSALSDEVEDVRRAALEQLPLLDTPNAADLLIGALRTETPRNRAAAAHALRLIDGAAADAALIQALDDAHPWVRYFAAAALGHRGTRAAVPSLEGMAAADEAPHVRIAAIAALAQLDVEAVVRTGLAIASDPDDDVAAAAIQALAHGAGTRVEQVLERAISSSRVTLPLAAAAALGGLNSHAAVQTLAWAARLAEPPSLSGVAMSSLRRMAAANGEASAAAVSALLHLGADATRREAVVRLLSKLPAAALPPITTAWSSGVRVTAVEALARMRTAEATARVADALTDPEPRVRAAAVTAFGRLGSAGIADRITHLATADPDSSVRRHAVAVCRRYGWIAAARGVEGR